MPKKGRIWLLAFCIMGFVGCANKSSTTQDPVTTETPDTQPGENQETETQPPTTDDFPAEAVDNPPSSEAATNEELPGTLSDDPYGIPPAPSADAAGENTTIDDYSGALEEDLPKNEAPPAPAVSSGAGATTQKVKAGKKVTRYVKATLLNVRSKPNAKAPVVRRLLGGAKIQVEIQGRFAKIREGQWCRIKYLSAKPTRKVSRQEAEKALKNTPRKKLKSQKKL